MAHNPDFCVTKEGWEPLEQGTNFYYDERDPGRLPGSLLSWQDFVRRNRNRTVHDINRWYALDRERIESIQSKVPEDGPRKAARGEEIFYYERWEDGDGLLPEIEFRKRNPHRNLKTIEKYHSLAGTPGYTLNKR